MAKRLLILLVAVCLACKPQEQQPSGKPAAAGPAVRGTVVTIRTTVQPANRTFTHTLVIAGDRARHSVEQDEWRIFDTKAQTVTFVDDVDRTYRTEPLADLTKRRRTANATAIAPFHPRVTLTRTGTRKTIQGASAEQALIAAGRYKRELWLAEHPSIPGGLFAMIHASEGITSPLAPMMSAVDEALLTAKGFPLVDRAEIPLGKGNVTVERTVVGIAQQQVPESSVAIPRGYKDVTPKPAPPAKKRR